MDKAQIEGILVSILDQHKKGSPTELIEWSKPLNLPEPLTIQNIYPALDSLKQKDIIIRSGAIWILKDLSGGKFYDWEGNFRKLCHLYEKGINPLLIGPPGCGKTISILLMAEKYNQNIHSLNLSLRCREQHLLGRLDLQDGNINWKKGPLPLSMEEGSILMLDEINQSEPDVLIRLNECLDDRRELNYEGLTIHAKPSWFFTASINPLDCPGAKELPQQILSRFSARLVYNYPPAFTELKIVERKLTLESQHRDDLLKVLKLFENIRSTDEYPYRPTTRESITAAHLLNSGYSLTETIDLTLINAMRQWGTFHMDNLKTLAHSLGCYEEQKVKADDITI
ncbi:MAG: AAA family ATPase [Candidatus Paceibacterota bacterium]